MAKKSSESFRPGKLISRNADDIWNRPLTVAEKEVIRRIAKEQAEGDFSNINYEDIPPLTDEQLASAVRARDVRPAKVAVSVRLDPRVLEWLKSKGTGHLTRINDILSNVMDAERRRS
jgi:uncharacterized protein (DUF4415 family)